MTGFNHIIITAPSQAIANSYQRQLQLLSSNIFTSIDLDSCFDPSGKRVGSGGGTLNAIDYLTSKYGYDHILNSRILIIHSGGDSRRFEFDINIQE